MDHFLTTEGTEEHGGFRDRSSPLGSAAPTEVNLDVGSADAGGLITEATEGNGDLGYGSCVVNETPEVPGEHLNSLTGRIIDAAFRVHSALGPGLLESAYEACLAYELRKRGLEVRSQVALPLIYETETLEVGYRIDLLVENSVIVELKTAERITGLHEAQLLSYLKLSGKKVGLILNFHVLHMRNGIKRMAN